MAKKSHVVFFRYSKCGIRWREYYSILSELKHAVYNKFVTIVPITRIFIQNPPIWYDTFLLKKLFKKKFNFEPITANNILYCNF